VGLSDSGYLKQNCSVRFNGIDFDDFEFLHGFCYAFPTRCVQATLVNPDALPFCNLRFRNNWSWNWAFRRKYP
ncbi:MAG: hypothetical protein ACK5PZ_06645, partial [Pirellula sp.]